MMIRFYLKITLILQIRVRLWLSTAKIETGLSNKKKVRDSVMSENTLFLF